MGSAPSAPLRDARTLAPDDPRHGTTNGYKNLRCRCTPCRLANSAACKAYKHRVGIVKRTWAEHVEFIKRHGISAYKRRRCRCDVCRAAVAAEKRRWRARHPEAVADENEKRADRQRRASAERGAT